MSGRLAISGEVGPSAEARLREACAQFEGVFTQQLLKAMRETVPEDGVLSGGLGEELFNGLFDQHLAEEAALRQSGGLGEILYQQLRSAMAHTIVSTAVLDGKER
jgi:flagellar protein FlgJ